MRERCARIRHDDTHRRTNAHADDGNELVEVELPALVHVGELKDRVNKRGAGDVEEEAELGVINLPREIFIDCHVEGPKFSEVTPREASDVRQRGGVTIQLKVKLHLGPRSLCLRRRRALLCRRHSCRGDRGGGRVHRRFRRFERAGLGRDTTRDVVAHRVGDRNDERDGAPHDARR